jgi:hypothetical protein
MTDFATSEGTLNFSIKFGHLKYRRLGTTGLYSSPAGFGGYRIHNSVEEHRNALKLAITNGINLIDTSSNYADGGSEELVGSVINELILNGKLRRDAIIIVSKGGYLQGQNFKLSQHLKQQNKPFPELVEYSPQLEHCIHPEFLEDQLTRSLNRLNLKTLDVYLLHNPEYYLLWAHNNGIKLSKAREEMYKRIEKAFLHLEIEVQNKRICYYGVSSNSFPVASNRYDFLELERIQQMAESISADHNFRVVQFPFNLLEDGAFNQKNQSNQKSILEFCSNKNFAALINRPLNAFHNNQLNRLCTIQLQGKSDEKETEGIFKKLIKLEDEFVVSILTTLNLPEDIQENLSGLFSGARYLSIRYKELGPYWQWVEQQASYLTDQISYAVQIVNEAPTKTARTIQWLDEYVALFNILFGKLTLLYGQLSAAENDKIFQKYKRLHHLPDAKTLQQLGIQSILRNDAVSSVLIGMRRSEYVLDVLNILKKKIVKL